MTLIHSMTGSASRQVNSEFGSISVSVNSVNSRYIETYFRLSDELKGIESKIRKLVNDKFARGKFEITINLKFSDNQELEINNILLEKLSFALKKIQASVGGEINPMDVLNYPGILGNDPEIQNKVTEQVLLEFSNTLDELKLSRAQEGQRISLAIMERLNEISEHLNKIGSYLDNLVLQERERVLDRIKNLKLTLDPERLEQEVVIIAQKADIREEYDRLRSHVKEASRLLHEGGLVGKRLDFLMQEFNREANTMASKASTLAITHIAVELKVLIEQMREQVQNLE